MALAASLLGVVGSGHKKRSVFDGHGLARARLAATTRLACLALSGLARLARLACLARAGLAATARLALSGFARLARSATLARVRFTRGGMRVNYTPHLGDLADGVTVDLQDLFPSSLTASKMLLPQNLVLFCGKVRGNILLVLRTTLTRMSFALARVARVSRFSRCSRFACHG